MSNIKTEYKTPNSNFTKMLAINYIYCQNVLSTKANNS